MEDIVDNLIKNYPELRGVIPSINDTVNELIKVYANGGKILLCGNGGSAADCEHIVGELLKEFKIKRTISEEMKDKLLLLGASKKYLDNIYGALPAVSLVSHIGFITAFNNDAESDYVFAQQLYALGKSGDALIAISTSGNSINIINAALMAKAKNIFVISMTGESGGKLRKYSDILINVPSMDTARIQEYHLPIYHVICELLEKYFFS
jgi:D-sedoheptulose 7-phosphate isomerase